MSESSDPLFKFLVTTIEVKGVSDDPVEGYGEDAKLVKFSGTILAEQDDSDFVYLMDVQKPEVNALGKHDPTVYQGISVTKEYFIDCIIATGKKVLACLHGFQAEPTSWMDTCEMIQNGWVEEDGNRKEFEHIVLPIIWPSVGEVGGLSILREYKNEQKIALQAGFAFRSIVGSNKVSLSLMCHSMGNRVLLSFARQQDENDLPQVFDNIFMVAADVWEEVFNTRVIDGSRSGMMDWKDTGLKLVRMVSQKINIVHYEDDRALFWSSANNGWKTHTRLGRFGKAGQQDHYWWNGGDRVHNECVPKIVDLDMMNHEKEVEAIDPDNKHSYQACAACIKFYNQQMK